MVFSLSDLHESFSGLGRDEPGQYGAVDGFSMKVPLASLPHNSWRIAPGVARTIGNPIPSRWTPRRVFGPSALRSGPPLRGFIMAAALMAAQEGLSY